MKRMLKLGMAVAMGTLLTEVAKASTLTNGNVSGTWTVTGSPYIATADLTVPSGTVLTLQPGVTIEIPSGVNFTVNGHIVALGTTSQPISFESPPGSGEYFAGF